MMKKKILVVTENEQELRCLDEISKRISELYCDADMVHISLNSLYLQTPPEMYQELGLQCVDLFEDVKLNKPFPFLSGGEKIRFVRRYMGKIEDLVRNADAVITGIDGTLQRAFVSKAKKHNRKAFQILISLVFDQDMRASTLKDKIIFSVLSMFNKNYYYYGKICSAPFEKVFVCGDVVKEALISGGVKSDKIVVSGIPRFASLYSNNRADECNTNKFRILYLCGAYGWHRDYDGEHIEKHAMETVLDVVNGRDDVHVTFKIHPRADLKCYEWLKPNNRVSLENSCNLVEMYPSHDLVVSLRSTCMFESVVAGTPALALMTSMDRDIDKDYFKEIEKCIEPVCVDEFEVKFNSYLDDKSQLNDLRAKEKRAVARYISPRSVFSADSIAREIIRSIG
jgi:hypothetical protein